ncbi:hypothetical protein BGW38_009299, partial [Lunasporangiospora selenospora]
MQREKKEKKFVGVLATNSVTATKRAVVSKTRALSLSGGTAMAQMSMQPPPPMISKEMVGRVVLLNGTGAHHSN